VLGVGQLGEEAIDTVRRRHEPRRRVQVHVSLMALVEVLPEGSRVVLTRGLLHMALHGMMRKHHLLTQPHDTRARVGQPAARRVGGRLQRLGALVIVGAQGRLLEY
jgi:hypothetical protein